MDIKNFSLKKLNFLKIKGLKTKYSRFPSFSQWKKIIRILTKKEKTALGVFFILFLSSLIFLITNFYLKSTEIRPAVGGIYLEGVIGHPRFINPIYAGGNDPDRDLVELIFSGLMKYNDRGQIIPDLVSHYEVEEDGKLFKFYLKENVFWHDGEKLTADDIIFTIKTIQNPDYKSPLRANWLGVDVEKISETELHFKLKKPYSAFLEITTLKIIPKHTWQDISPQNFPLAIYNLQPIGSGPYQFKSLKQTETGSVISLDLVRHQKYFNDEKPYLSQISFHFFDNERDLIDSANKREIKGFAIGYPKNYSFIKDDFFQEISAVLPRYFAIFLNSDKLKFFSEKKIRQALNYGTNKEEIVEKVLAGHGEIVHSPVLPEIYGFKLPSKIYEFDLKAAKELLEKANFIEDDEGNRIKIIKKEPAFQFKSDLRQGSQGKEVTELQKCLAQDPEVYPEGKITGYFGTQTKKAIIKFQEKYTDDILKPWGFEKGTGLVSKTTRAKLNELCGGLPKEEILQLKFTLVTVEDPTLEEVAAQLKNQWQVLGIEVEIKTYPISLLEHDFIKTRNYDALLFGEALTAIPDPFPFWHSSQKKDPGLNLVKYENKKADKLLEEARISLNPEVWAEKYQEFQDILIEDAPGVFLYSPDYIYFISKEIKGIEAGMIVDPSKRFAGIENWYIKTKRGWK